jgi:hypothetical protein
MGIGGIADFRRPVADWEEFLRELRELRIFTNWGGEISRKERKDHKMKDLHTASPDISQWGLVFGKNRLKVEKRGAAGSSRAHLNGARSYQS